MNRLLCLSLILVGWWIQAVSGAVVPALALPPASQQCLSIGYDPELPLLAEAEGDNQKGEGRCRYHLVHPTFDEEWQRYKSELPRKRHFLRAAGELGLLLLGGTAWYWLNQDFNQRDWDLDPTLDTLLDKITGQAVRFDTNTIYTNILNHPFTAVGYYTVARSNGYTALESFLFTLAGSTVWEYFIEYLEYASLNDQIFSSVGGTVIGEAFYQLGEFFSTSADNTANGILQWVFGAPQNLHRWVDDNPATRATSTDRFGFRNDIWHQFSLFSGFGVADDTFIAEVGVETQIIHLPGYGTRLGTVSAFIDETVFTQMSARASFGEGGVQDLSLFMKVMLLGYFHQHLTRSPNGTLSGYSLFIGPATAYELNRHDWSQTGIEDIYGIINIVGPSIDLVYYWNRLRMRLSMDIYGDFAAMRAFALDAFEQVGTLESAKSVLRDQEYYFALGLTSRAQATLTYGRLEVGTSGRYSYYDSIEGLDRRQEEITNDVETTDTVASVRAWIAYETVDDFIKVLFSYERRWRSGTASDGNVTASESETENRFLGSVVLQF